MKAYPKQITNKGQPNQAQYYSSRGKHKCEFCQNMPDTSSYSFFSCQVAYKIQSSCYNWLGFNCALPMNASCHLLQHVGMVNWKKRKKVWTIIWFAVVWTIWNTRNKSIFKGTNASLERIKDSFIFYFLVLAERERKKFSCVFI